MYRQASAKVLVAVQPWPEYGQTASPAWPVSVLCVEPAKRWTVVWSVRLRRFASSHAARGMARVLTPEDLRAVENAVLDALEGSLC